MVLYKDSGNPYHWSTSANHNLFLGTIKSLCLNIKNTICAMITITRHQRDHGIWLGEEQLKHITDLKYMGVYIYLYKRILRIHINTRISKYSTELGLWLPLLRQKWSEKGKCAYIYQTTLHPGLTYGSEAWKHIYSRQ